MSSRSSVNSATDPPARAPVHELEERVRYSETDGMGVAHHRNYFVWFELARTELCRSRGLTYREIEEQGFFIVVVEAACQYKKPLRYDDPFIVRTTLREAGPKKFVFSYEILRPEDRQVLATGETVHLVVNRHGRVCPLPQALLGRLAGPGRG